MQDKPSGAGNEGATSTPLDEDDRSQASVLRELIEMYPEPITVDELTRKMTLGSGEFSEQDRIGRAIRDLTAGGLLYCREDDLVIPTRAAVRLYVLFEL